MTDDRAATPDGPDLPEERVLAALESMRTPEQQQLAAEIFRRLSAGEDVDDVKGLIDQMAKVIAQQRHEPRIESSDNNDPA